VDTFYLRRDISPSDAKTIILETLIAFKFIFPLANVMEVKFVGIKDNSMDGDETVRRKELRNKKIWREANVGDYSMLDSSFIVDFNTCNACNSEDHERL